MLAHRLPRWSNISPVLGYRVVFGATLNVGQRHRRRANINPALDQRIVPLPECMKYWLGLNRYWPAPATLAQHSTDIGSVSACTRRQQYVLPDPQPSKHEALNQCWFDAGPVSQMVSQNWTSIGSTSRVCWECWQATLCFALRRVWRY